MQQGVRESAYRLAMRQPALIYDIQIHISSDKEHTEKPYMWGGLKQQSLANFMPELASGAQTCCLSCAWRLPCADPHQLDNGHRIEMGALLAMDTLRESASLSAWLRELAFLRTFHQIDPLHDVKNHCGDVDSNWLRVRMTPKVDRWLEPSLAPPGPPCGIKRDKNEKFNDPRRLKDDGLPKCDVHHWLFHKTRIPLEELMKTTPRFIFPCRARRMKGAAETATLEMARKY